MAAPQLTALQLTAKRQAVWSKTANILKKRYGTARLWTFMFMILGAFLAMIASQCSEGQPRLYLAGLSTVVFAMVSFLTARLLGQEHALAWVRSRAAAEALKREAYKYAARAAPYDDGDRDERLNDEREHIESDMTDILSQAVADEGDTGSVPTTDLTPDEYIRRRITDPIKSFFNPKADMAQRKARMFRRAELLLAAVTALITAVVGLAGKDPLGWGFDFVAFAAVLTTISGTILAHIEAERFDYTVAQYRATARRLEGAVASASKAFATASPDWSAFVAKCEGILSDENSSWVAKWSKP
jgi:SMODS and SLOG-associating 2TM effector domain 1/Protein of unknown function (DUF4231)